MILHMCGSVIWRCHVCLYWSLTTGGAVIVYVCVCISACPLVYILLPLALSSKASEAARERKKGSQGKESLCSLP